MEPRTIGAVINALVVTGHGVVAAWRGFQRRRSTLSLRSWLGLTLTLLIGIALIGFRFVFSLAVDRHEPWVGPPRSSTREHWIVLVLGAMATGLLLSCASLWWFGYGDPDKQLRSSANRGAREPLNRQPNRCCSWRRAMERAEALALLASTARFVISTAAERFP
jgi:hypothetical protein